MIPRSFRLFGHWPSSYANNFPSAFSDSSLLPRKLWSFVELHWLLLFFVFNVRKHPSTPTQKLVSSIKWYDFLPIQIFLSPMIRSVFFFVLSSKQQFPLRGKNEQRDLGESMTASVCKFKWHGAENLISNQFHKLSFCPPSKLRQALARSHRFMVIQTKARELSEMRFSESLSSIMNRTGNLIFYRWSHQIHFAIMLNRSINKIVD